MSSAGITQPESSGLGISRDLFYFWAVQQFSILPGKEPAPAGSAPHIPADTNALPRAAWALALGFLGFLQSQRQEELPRIPTGMELGALTYAGMGERSKKEIIKKKVLKK